MKGKEEGEKRENKRQKEGGEGRREETEQLECKKGYSISDSL